MTALHPHQLRRHRHRQQHDRDALQQPQSTGGHVRGEEAQIETAPVLHSDDDDVQYAAADHRPDRAESRCPGGEQPGHHPTAGGNQPHQARPDADPGQRLGDLWCVDDGQEIRRASRAALSLGHEEQRGTDPQDADGDHVAGEHDDIGCPAVQSAAGVGQPRMHDQRRACRVQDRAEAEHHRGVGFRVVPFGNQPGAPGEVEQDVQPSPVTKSVVQGACHHDRGRRAEQRDQAGRDRQGERESRPRQDDEDRYQARAGGQGGEAQRHQHPRHSQGPLAGHNPASSLCCRVHNGAPCRCCPIQGQP